MTGDGLVRPLNAPSTAPLAYGTQPGVNQAVVIANKVIVFGASGGVFVYDPTPGLGNLIASATDASTDPYGNATLPGVTGYSKSGGVFYAASMGPSLGGASAFTIWTSSSAAGPYTNQGGIAADSSGNMTVGAAGNLTLNTVAGVLRATRDASSFAGYVPLVQVDGTTSSVGNTATAGDITAAWTVPASDGVAGTSYVIRALATLTIGQTTAETLTIGADIDAGTLIPLATLGAAFNGSTLSATYDIPLTLTLDVDAVSANTPQIWLDGPLGNTSANRLSVNSANMSGNSNTATWTKTSAHTLAIYAQWGGAGGSVQVIKTIKSKFYREGP